MELKYHSMEKHAYALVMFLKHFKVFVGYSNIMVYVLHLADKEILKQQDGMDIGPCGLQRSKNMNWKYNPPIWS